MKKILPKQSIQLFSNFLLFPFLYFFFPFCSTSVYSKLNRILFLFCSTCWLVNNECVGRKESTMWSEHFLSGYVIYIQCLVTHRSPSQCLQRINVELFPTVSNSYLHKKLIHAKKGTKRATWQNFYHQFLLNGIALKSGWKMP